MDALLVLTKFGEEVEVEGGKNFKEVLSLISQKEEILEVKKTTLSDKSLRRVEVFGLPFLMFVKNKNFYFRPEYRFEKAYRKMRGKIRMIEGFIEKPLTENVSCFVLGQKDSYLARILVRR